MHWAHSVQYSRSNSICMVNLKFIKLLFASQRPITEFVQTKSADWRTRSDKPMKMNKYRIYNRHMCIQITVQTKQNIINFNKLQCALYGEKNIHKYYKQKKMNRTSCEYQCAIKWDRCFSLSITYTQMKKKLIGKLSTACFGFAIHNIRTINFVLEFSLFDDNSFVSTKYDYNSQDVQLFICDE